MEFIVIPSKVLLAEVLSDKAKVVYFLLVKYSYDSVTCFPSVDTLKKDLEVTKVTVLRALDELKRYGLIRVYRECNFKHNTYILLPIDWVDFTEVDEGSYFIDNLEEFEGAKKKIMLYYEENGLEVTAKKKKGSKSVKTPADIIKEIEDKIAEDAELSMEDYAKYLFKRVYEEYGQVISYKGVRVNSALKRVFSGVDRKDVLLIIDIYVVMYATNFKREGYEVPLPQYLGIGWIYNKVINRFNSVKLAMLEEVELDIMF